MSHVSKLLLLSCLACAFACTVPTIDELENERPDTYYHCNSDHMCPSGSVCFEERCIRTEGLACEPGTRVACGTDEGECQQGTQLCGAQGLPGGACEGVIAPVFEKCDDKDNDCDGEADDRAEPIVLTRKHDGSTPAAAIAVRRKPDGSQDRLLTLTAEEGSIVARTLSADGIWTQGAKLNLALLSYRLPTLAAQGDMVAAAWVGVKPPEAPAEPPTYMVFLTTLDGSGAVTGTQLLDIPYASSRIGPSPVEPEQLKLAINRTHILVLVKTPDAAYVVTVSRDLDVATRRGPIRLGSTFSDRWFQASPDASGAGFVVAYQDTETNITNGFVTYFNHTSTVSNDGVLGSKLVINKGTLPSLPHSPFILPLLGIPLEYRVFYVENGIETESPKSRISSTKCSATGCATAEAFATFENEVQRMQMVAPPGAIKPEVALFRWHKTRSDPPTLTAVTFTDKSDWRTDLQPSGQQVLSASLVVMPDSTRYLLYNQPPLVASWVSSLAVGFEVTEAHVQPFCDP